MHKIKTTEGYSKGGNGDSSKRGKVWQNLGYVKSHLNMMDHNNYIKYLNSVIVNVETKEEIRTIPFMVEYFEGRKEGETSQYSLTEYNKKIKILTSILKNDTSVCKEPANLENKKAIALVLEKIDGLIDINCKIENLKVGDFHFEELSNIKDLISGLSID